jgi:hypothetical protein
MGVRASAFLWSLAEATLFFIVPDVLLTYVAGGAVMLLWSWSSPQTALAAVAMVPNVSDAMLQGSRASLEQDGIIAMFLGSFQGVPYKTYAIAVLGAGLDPLLFLATTFPARIVRFCLAALFAAAISALFSKAGMPQRMQLTVLALAWIGFYIFYVIATTG